MANNVSVKDSAAADKTFKTTDNAGVHTPHHNVDSSALPTGAATSAKQDTIIGHLDGVETLLGTIDGDTQNLAGTVFADGASWTDDTSTHILIGGVYQSSPHTVTNNDTTPFLTDANGRMAVAHSALTKLDSAIATELQVDVVGALPAGTNNIGDVDILSIAAGNNNIGNVDIVTMPDTRQDWRVSTLSFSTTNDSDTSFTVPATTEYQILGIRVELITTATAGNRQMAVLITDGSDVVEGELRAGATQAASLTRYYQWGPGMPQETAFRDTNYIACAMHPIFMTAGHKIRVYDKAAVDAAADDMVVKIKIASRSIA